jgi:hypothetical protein
VLLAGVALDFAGTDDVQFSAALTPVRPDVAKAIGDVTAPLPALPVSTDPRRPFVAVVVVHKVATRPGDQTVVVAHGFSFR